MRIKEFSILRYGPLVETGRIRLNSFNLLWGKNEYGKSLTIDALVKLLFGKGKNLKFFPAVDRVEEEPEGYIIIESNTGETIKIPEHGYLPKLVGLSAEDCRNIFIVRNSDLSIALDFVDNITDRLIGLRSADIEKIKNAIIDIARITRDKGDFLDVKGEKLKSRLQAAEQLLARIEAMKAKIVEEEYDILEEKAAKIQETIEDIKHRKHLLEDACKREKYEKGKAALEKLKDAKTRYDELRVFNEQDEQRWREAQKSIERYREEQRKLEKKLEEKRKERDALDQELLEIEQNFTVLERKKKTIEEDIKPLLKNTTAAAEEIEADRVKDRFYGAAVIASSALFFLSLLGLLMQSSLIFFVISMLSGLATVVFAFLKYSTIRKKASLAATLQKLKSMCIQIGIEAEDVRTLSMEIQKYEEFYLKEMHRRIAVIERRNTLEKEIAELEREELPRVERSRSEKEQIIEDIRSRTGVDSLEQYVQKRRSQQQYEKVIIEQRSVLESLFDSRKGDLSEAIAFWDREIQNLAGFKEKAVNIQCDQSKIEELEQQRERLDYALKMIKERMQTLRKDLDAIAQKANEILQGEEEEQLYCETSTDLAAIEERLRQFIEEHERIRENAIVALRIMDEIEGEEKRKVSQLFGRDKAPSRYFYEITGGLYTQVLYNQEARCIEVQRKDNTILRADQLSGGAYDQLYFSIRLALGDMLLKNHKGFFILDDPFIKADPERIQRQIEMLRKVSHFGWQIIFFSAKGEIKEALCEDIESGTVNYIEFAELFAEH